MLRPKPDLTEIYGEEAVRRVAEEEVFLPNAEGHGGITMYQNRCGGCVNWALLMAAGWTSVVGIKFPGELTTLRFIHGDNVPDLEDGVYPTRQFKVISRLITLNDTGRLQTREQVMAALMEEVGDEAATPGA